MLAQMTKREYSIGESDRFYEFRAIDKKLAWRPVGPHSESLFSVHLDGPPDPWVSCEQLRQADSPIAQTWRRALIDASGVTPRNFED